MQWPAPAGQSFASLVHTAGTSRVSLLHQALDYLKHCEDACTSNTWPQTRGLRPWGLGLPATLLTAAAIRATTVQQGRSLCPPRLCTSKIAVPRIHCYGVGCSVKPPAHGPMLCACWGASAHRCDCARECGRLLHLAWSASGTPSRADSYVSLHWGGLPPLSAERVVQPCL